MTDAGQSKKWSYISIALGLFFSVVYVIAAAVTGTLPA